MSKSRRLSKILDMATSIPDINGKDKYGYSDNKNLLIGVPSDNGIDKLQVGGSISATRLHGVADSADKLTTPIKINGVPFDGTSNITILENVDNTRDVDKNVLSATKLTTPRSISLAGDATGSVSFDGTSDITITADIKDDSHNHKIGNVDGLQDILDKKAPLDSPAFTGVPTVPTAKIGTNTTQIATTEFVETATAPAQLLENIKTVDGSNSGLDADKLDGMNTGSDGANYIPYVNSSGNMLIGTTTDNGTDKLQVNGSISASKVHATADYAGSMTVYDERGSGHSTNLYEKLVRYDFKNNGVDGLSDGGNYYGSQTFQPWPDSTGGHTYNLAYTVNGNIWYRTAPINGSWGSWNKIWHSGNDGAGSGLDADKLDGMDSSQFLRKDVWQAMFPGKRSTLNFEDQGTFFRFAFFKLAFFDWDVGRDILTIDDSGLLVNGDIVASRIHAIADKADKLTTARTISLTGDVTGAASFDGTGNVNISATVVNKNHSHTISSINGLQNALNSKSDTSHNHDSLYMKLNHFNGQRVWHDGLTISNFSTNGYQKLPSGLILQWGKTGDVNSDTETTISFPITFPHTCLNVVATAASNTDSDIAAAIKSISSSQLKLERGWWGGTVSTGPIYWFAIGY